MIKQGIYGLGLLFLSLLTIQSCLDAEVESLNFFGVSFSTPKTTGVLGEVLLEGSVDVNGLNNLVEQGFLISEELDDLNSIETANKQVGQLSTDGTFTTKLENLSLEKIFYFKSYAIFNNPSINKNRTVLSETTIPFSFNVKLGTLADVEVLNNTATIGGFIVGLENLGIQIEQHGFIYSQNPNALLELNESGIDTVQLGIINDDAPFYSLLKGLEFNTAYYFRPWAKTNQNIYYGEEIKTINVKGGWTQASTPGFRLDSPFGASTATHAYFMGCDFGNDNCDAFSSQSIFTFNLNENSWTEHPGVETNARKNGTSFIIDDIFYIGFGRSTNFPLVDFYKIDLANIGSSTMQFINPQPPDTLTQREGAVAIVINGKAYFGSGLDDLGRSLNDFWEYNPVTEIWREVASLPLRKNPQSGAVDEGRYEAIAFALGEFGYVGAGANGPLMLQDFWRFTPPSNDTDLGSWTFQAFFQGLGRIDATYFTIDDQGYFGTGENLTLGFLNDFWQFDPTRNPAFFKRLEDLPSRERSRATGFNINQQGYLGLGGVRVLDDNDLPILELLSDFWMYTPEN